MTVGRKDGRTVCGCLALSGLMWLLVAPPLSAQVGYPPPKSPYRDIPRGSSWSLLVGHLSGNAGSLGIGPKNGMSYGFRYDIRSAGFVTGGLAISYFDVERQVVDADAPAATRRSGPFKMNVVNPELVLQFNLTGGKSWHHIAPFFTGALGYALGSDVKQDTSGYQFGNRFTVSPGGGFRYFLGNHFNLRFEARRHFWKLKYPPAYLDTPANDPSGSPVITNGKTSDWSSTWWLLGGVSFSF